MGLWKQRDGYYTPTPRGRLVGRVILAISAVLLLTVALAGQALRASTGINTYTDVKSCLTLETVDCDDDAGTALPMEREKPYRAQQFGQQSQQANTTTL